MSANFYELLKYAATGIASPDMTYYDKMRASMLMGGVVQTLTGIPPLSFKADGTPLISWSLKGNGVQSGNPIQPTFCGVRTAQLFDKDTAVYGEYINEDGTVMQEGAQKTAWLSDYIPVTAGSTYTLNRTGSRRGKYFKADKTPYQTSTMDFSGLENKNTFTVPETVAYIRFTIYKGYATPDVVMLNLGSTALHYEPFGYKIQISCAGQTTTVYLGEVPTVRRIKKLVLDGTEEWQTYGQVSNTYRVSINDAQSIGNPALCSHFENTPISTISSGKFTVGSTWIYIRYADATDVTDFKAYLAQQYANGTPVTIWYVLANEQTGIVNEPLAKIGDYADELHSEDAGVTIPTVKGSNTLTVETDLQPSEMSITYKG